MNVMERRPAFLGCGLSALLPPLGVDVATLIGLLWLLAHDTARERGASLSGDEAWEILRAATPELAWAAGGAGLKWLSWPVGAGFAGWLNLKAARNVQRATKLYLTSGRRLRGRALRSELEEALHPLSRRA